MKWAKKMNSYCDKEIYFKTFDMQLVYSFLNSYLMQIQNFAIGIYNNLANNIRFQFKYRQFFNK